MRKIENKEHKRKLREICFSFREEFNQADRLPVLYRVLYDVQELARRELKKKLQTWEIMEDIGRIFGVSSQTLYRARAAVRADRNHQMPKKYAAKSYRNLINNIRAK